MIQTRKTLKTNQYGETVEYIFDTDCFKPYYIVTRRDSLVRVDGVATRGLQTFKTHNMQSAMRAIQSNSKMRYETISVILYRINDDIYSLQTNNHWSALDTIYEFDGFKEIVSISGGQKFYALSWSLWY